MQVEKNNSGAVIRGPAVSVHVEGPNEGFSFFLVGLPQRELLLEKKEVHSPGREVACLTKSGFSRGSQPTGCVSAK